MLELDHLTVSGDVTFGRGVSLRVSTPVHLVHQCTGVLVYWCTKCTGVLSVLVYWCTDPEADSPAEGDVTGHGEVVELQHARDGSKPAIYTTININD